MLEFDYQQAIRQVEELRQIADELRRVKSQSVESAINSVGASWKGETSQRFLTKCGEIRDRIEKEAANISDIADSLEASAKQIAEEEASAASIISERSFAP